MSDPRLGFERPQNLQRSAFHAAWGLFAVWLASTYLSPMGLIWVSGGFTLIAWSLELLKRVSERGAALFERLFGSITHQHERERVNSATWYCSAVFISTLLFSPTAVILSVLCLAVGDPIAGLIGRRYRRVRLIGRRTLEGTLAFALSASLVSWLYLKLQYPTLEPAPLIALAGASAAAIAELLSGSWLDDNLTVPLSAASAISAALSMSAA